jgi:hypothetical protein
MIACSPRVKSAHVNNPPPDGVYHILWWGTVNADGRWHVPDRSEGRGCSSRKHALGRLDIGIRRRAIFGDLADKAAASNLPNDRWIW